jgi:signal transduction histidine kinase
MAELKAAEHVRPTAGAALQTAVILRADESGRVVSCSGDIQGVGLSCQAVSGKHWQALFPGFEKVRVSAREDVEQFLLVRKGPDARAYRVSVHDSIGADGQADGAFVLVEAEGPAAGAALGEFEKVHSLGRMAGEFAHELNNTLTSITGWLQILAQDLAGDDPRRESLDIILGEAKRTARTASALLAMARGEAGAQHTRLNLNALLDVVSGLVEPSLKRNGIELKKDLRDLPPVIGCDDELKQVLLNLLLNAANAIEDGGCITVSTEAIDHRHVCAKVTDTGCGIAPEALGRVFEAFYTTRPDKGGTGLGLFVSRRIVKQHNGDLLVDSTPGVGSSFTVLLPAAIDG